LKKEFRSLCLDLVSLVHHLDQARVKQLGIKVALFQKRLGPPSQDPGR
jgi:hypothetical protein